MSNYKAQITNEQLQKINAINGTQANRVDYFKAVKEITGGRYITAHACETPKANLIQPDGTRTNIYVKTIKGQLQIDEIRIVNDNTTPPIFEIWTLNKKTGALELRVKHEE